MKRFSLILRMLAVMLPAALISTSCIMDWYPITLMVDVQDAYGNDMLNPGSELFIGENISVEYEGKVYPMEIKTKAYMPMFSGLELVKNSGRWSLQFGELDGGRNHNDTFTIKWPDGKKDIVTFHRTIMTPLVVIDTWWLNGRKTGLPIVIEK